MQRASPVLNWKKSFRFCSFLRCHHFHIRRWGCSWKTKHSPVPKYLQGSSRGEQAVQELVG